MFIKSVFRLSGGISHRGFSSSNVALQNKVKGRINAKKPIRIELEEGKSYLWCACGYSKNQPWCDGSHKTLKTKQTPLPFKASKTGQVSLCTCKQTNKEPYCDGTHKKKEVQDAVIE
ncbi:2 iron, 2 sulfur cluster binding [Halocaridina rubra]|uniref:2 iron, 2 sulfur cluster binding n=1 Tax=Halocaridina rubra TaxID=373956 RepID=A0AAN8WUZ7_HALRR